MEQQPLGTIPITHKHPDTDALLAVAMVLDNCPWVDGSKVRFEDANWIPRPDEAPFIAVDMDAGGAGYKGHLDDDGTQHSASQWIMEHYVPERDQRKLASQIKFLDVSDSYGDAHLHLYGNKISLDLRMMLIPMSMTGFSRAMRSTSSADGAVGYKASMALVQMFRDMLRGFLLRGELQLKGKRFVPPNVMDLDEVLAIAVCERYLPKRDRRPILKEGRFTGKFTDGTVLVGNPQDPNVGSLFAMAMRRYASEEEQALVQPLMLLMEAYLKNSTNPFEVILKGKLTPKERAFLSDTSMIACYEALRLYAQTQIDKGSDFDYDSEFIDIGRRILKAVRKSHEDAKAAHVMATSGDPRLTWLPNRLVVVIDNVGNHRLNDVLFNYYGVRAVVMLDGNYMILRRADGEPVRMDHPDLVKIVKAAGEYEEWKVKRPWLLGNGTRKSSECPSSTVDPMALARAADALFARSPR